MDKETNIQNLKEIVKKFCEDRNWDQFHNAKDLSIGIITEASELLELFRFKSNEEIENMFKDNKKRQTICEEISDTLYFILRLAQRYDIDLTKELINKIEKNNTKYPIEKAKGSNKKYTEL
jgi:NTP pyrophosphatase (non-canonical NTP hydrolase)